MALYIRETADVCVLPPAENSRVEPLADTEQPVVRKSPSELWLDWQIGLARSDPSRTPDWLRSLARTSIYCSVRAGSGLLTSAGMSNNTASTQYHRDAIGYFHLAILLDAHPVILQPDGEISSEAAFALRSIADSMEAI